MVNSTATKNNKKRKKKKPPFFRKYQKMIFFGILALGFIVSMLIPLRPQISEVEKRELSKFPKFSFAALTDGSWFEGIDTWYADTFPFREAMISFNSRIKELYGFGDRISGMSNDVVADVPDVVTPQSTAEQQTSASETTSKAENEPKVEEFDDSLTQNLGAVVIVNDTGYEVYNFSKKAADTYISAVGNAAKALDGKINVYDIVVPTSIDITLADKTRAKINTSSQIDAINYIYGSMAANVKTVNIYQALRAQRDKYIYFRTDHHWTALGAYFAYRELCPKLGFTPTVLSTDYTRYQFDGFLGSFYSETGKSPALKNNSDTIYAYDPKGETTLEFTEKSGKVVPWKVIYDVSDWGASSKYSTFIGPDNPYVHITNANVTDGSSCVVVKESFGNAFVPFLVPHYSEIHVIDYRYWKGSIASFAKGKGVSAVIYVNNVSATRSESLVNKLYSISN